MNYESNERSMAFDYIIVGAGPAGAVMAKTLSQAKNNTVLLLEAGENNDHDKEIINPTVNMQNFHPQYFWPGTTVPGIHLNGKIFDWTTGRLSGGGTSVNNMQHVMPTPHVLSKWEDLLGPMWSPLNIIRNFTQLENYNERSDYVNFHGYQGNLDIREAPEIVPKVTRKLISAIEQATGFKTILDYNNPATPLGPFHKWQLYQKPNGMRESASTAFLSEDVISSKDYGVFKQHLRIFYKTTALRVIFNESRVAIGVEFLKEGACQRALARKKVILSAGINSTQLLMLSGIGPVKDLTRAGIPVIYANSSVGKNLVNHTFNTALFTTNKEDTNEISKDPYALYTGGAFLPSPLLNTDKKVRSIQLISTVTNGLLILMILYLLPESRGSITIQNDDPLKIVLASENFLNNPSDLEVIKGAYRSYIKNIAEKLSSIDSAYQLLSPSIDIINDDTQLEQFINDNFGRAYHQQSSLRMAPLEDGGVVDSCGRVYGVHNLIVADDSIIPFTVDSNTTAPAYFIGYTIAKQLLGEVRIPNNSHQYPDYPWYSD